ncbi:hypothetical protein PIB30_008872 [Stylosanthes scabra]|uniref:Uncharacterized protein n=1 Tax=Stylosanthes scabra TaxID=79078 RepID=A0ABU6Z702_9FABA|nr:hypothetical protein [Stylosanthes scabra]
MTGKEKEIKRKTQGNLPCYMLVVQLFKERLGEFRRLSECFKCQLHPENSEFSPSANYIQRVLSPLRVHSVILVQGVPDAIHWFHPGSSEYSVLKLQGENPEY